MSNFLAQLREFYRKGRLIDERERRKQRAELELLFNSTQVDLDDRILWMLNDAREKIEDRDLEATSITLDQVESTISESQRVVWLAELYRLRSVVLRRQGRNAEAFDLLVKAYTAGADSNDEYSLAHTSLNLGAVSANTGDYDGASVYLKRCLQHAELGRVDAEIPAQAHLILAQAQLERGAIEEADYHASAAITLFDKIGSVARSATAASLLASVKIEKRDLVEARRVLEVIDKSALPKVQLISLHNLEAKLNCLEGEYSEAHRHHDVAIQYATEISTVRLRTNSIQLKCETLLHQGQAAETLRLLNEVANDGTQGYDLLSLHELRGKALEQLGQYKEALEEQKQFAKLQKELLSERASNALSRLRAAQEVLQAEREAAHFRERSQFYAKELSQRTSYLVQQNDYVNQVIDHLQSLASQKPEAIEILKDIRKRLRQLPGASFDWNEYLRLFDEIHPNALAVLEQRYPDLSKTESKICTLVLAKLQNVDIARLLAVSERTVENHRYRLRKKLGISVDVDLSAYLEQVLSEQGQRSPKPTETMH